MFSERMTYYVMQQGFILLFVVNCALSLIYSLYLFFYISLRLEFWALTCKQLWQVDFFRSQRLVLHICLFSGALRTVMIQRWNQQTYLIMLQSCSYITVSVTQETFKDRAVLLTHLGKTPSWCSALVPMRSCCSSANQILKLLSRHLCNTKANSVCALSSSRLGLCEENIWLFLNVCPDWSGCRGRKGQCASG